MPYQSCVIIIPHPIRVKYILCGYGLIIYNDIVLIHQS